MLAALMRALAPSHMAATQPLANNQPGEVHLIDAKSMAFTLSACEAFLPCDPRLRDSSTVTSIPGLEGRRSVRRSLGAGDEEWARITGCFVCSV